jgi:hypothetical protein
MARDGNKCPELIRRVPLILKLGLYIRISPTLWTNTPKSPTLLGYILTRGPSALLASASAVYGEHRCIRKAFLRNFIHLNTIQAASRSEDEEITYLVRYLSSRWAVARVLTPTHDEQIP